MPILIAKLYDFILFCFVFHCSLRWDAAIKFLIVIGSYTLLADW